MATATNVEPPHAPVRPVRVGVVFGLAVAAVMVVSLVHVTQGTSGVGAADLLRLLIGDGGHQAAAVLVASRLPRLLAGMLVGVALGFAGTILQSVSRNPLASPDTLGVDAGAYFAVVATTSLGVSLPVLPAGGVAFVGGLLAAAVVLGLSAGGASGPIRLVLAGSALGMALYSASTFLLILDPEGTVGLYAWRAGTIAQTGLAGVGRIAPLVAVAVAVATMAARRLDLLALGDDAASVLGIRVGRTRVGLIVLSVFLTACSVAVAGPLGFVGLAAPALVRLAVARIPDLNRHRMLLPLSALAGILVVLTADVILRAALGGRWGVEVPTGVVTSVFGAVFLLWLASRYRESGRQQPNPSTGAVIRSRRRFVVTAVAAAVVVVAGGVVGMLGGDTWVLLGDLANWVERSSSPGLLFVLDTRLPRVLAALLAGAALGVAGTIVQGVSRNPLAEPGLLGITGGAGVAAVAAITYIPGADIWTITAAAAAGSLAAYALVYLLAARGGLGTERLVLVGMGVWFGTTALTTVILVMSDPWNLAMALTWLSGSTYGRTLPQVVPVAIALALVAPLAIAWHRRLDLMSLDEDAPRVLGLALGRDRLVALVGAAVVSAAAVSAIGVLGFVGLVAPHAARALVGGYHRRVLPVAALLGAALVSVADTVGRSVIAPGQIPAGLVTALLGAPYFLWLLWRTRNPIRG